MINLIMQSQPTDETCGATCLHALYTYYGLSCTIQTLAQNIERSASGGTLAPYLGTHALKTGFQASIYVNNLDLFDPTWFHQGEADGDFLLHKLSKSLTHLTNPGVLQENLAYQDFIQQGGRVCFRVLKAQLLKAFFLQKRPILTGLSATYLYNSPRERFTDQGVALYDDIQGTPCGHFVVLCGYDNHNKLVVVADPHRENPITHNNYYKVPISRLINAILLGVLTYDANLLIIEPQNNI